MSRLKVAFVASGGAVRGLAHLGVLKACEELGVLPEIFVGTSSGALVSATYGQDIPLDVLLDAYRLPWRRRHRGPRLFPSTFIGLPRPRELLDPGHLVSGIFSADRLENYLSSFLPINDFRKLPNAVFVTAVDIDSGERVVFGPGYDETTPISRAVAASCCVPGIFRPFRIGNRYFVNGEVARTLSADIAIAAGADVVIISNVYKPERVREGRRSLARRGPFPVLRQSLSVLLTEKERQGVELYGKLHPHVTFLDIAPELGPFSYLNRFAVRSLVLRGYRQALRVLADAKEKGLFDRTNKLARPLN
ncbi:patatin-like phospholipase family protein [Polyangium jinanense]|uniref:Patatin-like phospholipase family protein n=1 Tax=Polyangium jinanense TaxID=2829994 RepID=A0A9X3X7I9_9BACT|nr:patatin-like phospholipase family protein [Polyangium jinanense]MDC3983628.1 patatin-like phospholipase family protein [Polyangium jinanense]